MNLPMGYGFEITLGYLNHVRIYSVYVIMCPMNKSAVEKVHPQKYQAM